GLEIHCIDGEIYDANACITKSVGYIRAQQTAIRGQVDPEASLGGVIRDLVSKIRTQQRLATHHRQHATCGRMKPVDGALRHVFRHALYAVLKSPAVVTV